MDEANGWINGSFTDWIDGLKVLESPKCCGLFVVRWEQAQRYTSQDSVESAQSARRAERILRAFAMRLSRLTNAVLGWSLTGSVLFLAVTIEASDQEGAVFESGRLHYALRELLSQRLLSYAQRKVSANSLVQYRLGFGWLRKPTRDEFEADSLLPMSIILQALDEAYSHMWLPEQPPIRPALQKAAGLPGIRTNAVTVIEARYHPIVSLLDGSLYGYEAVPYHKQTGARVDLQQFFKEAEEAGVLYETDRAFREAAIRGFPSRNGDIKLFLPVPAAVVFDTRLYPGSTLRRIESAGLRSEHVVLVLFGEEVERGTGAALKAALSHYRQQGFRIALAGIEPKRSVLKRMLALHPDYAMLCANELDSDSSNSVEESLLQAMSALARKEEIVLIADGINHEQALSILVASGVSYGQGNWIGKAIGQNHSTAKPVEEQVQQRIRTEVERRYRGATGAISQLAVPVEYFARETPVSEIAKQFEVNRESQAIVITDNGRPVGLLMKEKLHQMLSGQFGLPLYWNRPVGKIMDAHPMMVEDSIPVDQVSQMAMAREPDKLYDAVVVTSGGELVGIVFVRAMLEWVTRTRMEFAQWANPLTGLPGNVPIQRELTRRLASGRPFAIGYADLDHFKWYNDQYGFHSGDTVIRYTADVLAGGIKELDPQETGESFVGHVGGDDFIVIVDGMLDPIATLRCLIKRFESGIEAYLGKHTGPVSDRHGHPVEGPGLTMSVALLRFDSCEGWTPELVSERSAHLKKKAKQQKGNSLVWEVAHSTNMEWSVT